MDSAILNETSEQFLGEWKRLVSTTNWDKGRIICSWREALLTGDALGPDCSDDAWSQNVGNVTPQHVGRLRRVYERFGAVRETYPGLFWSHFQAALDWEDAEMWLEGAVQNRWSISHMRRQRWEALGAPEELKPRPEDVIVAELDEDAEPGELGMRDTLAVVQAPRSSGEWEAAANSAFDDHDSSVAAEPFAGYPDHGGEQQPEPAEPVRPFAHLPSLPADVNDAFEAYKLCILRHKLAGWQEISRSDLLSSLDALKELALTSSRE